MLMGYVYDRADRSQRAGDPRRADPAGRRQHQAAAPSACRLPRQLGADGPATNTATYSLGPRRHYRREPTQVSAETTTVGSGVLASLMPNRG